MEVMLLKRAGGHGYHGDGGLNAVRLDESRRLHSDVAVRASGRTTRWSGSPGRRGALVALERSAGASSHTAGSIRVPEYGRADPLAPRYRTALGRRTAMTAAAAASAAAANGWADGNRKRDTTNKGRNTA